MAMYVSTFILRQDLVEADVEKITTEIGDIITEQGGKIVKKENWGLQSLAYKINKAKKGYYFHMGIDAPANALDEMTRKVRINEDIVRLLNVKVDSISDEPSAYLKSKEAE